MSPVSTMGVGVRRDGTVERYQPPRVVEEAGGGGPPPGLPGTPVIGPGQGFTAGNWVPAGWWSTRTLPSGLGASGAVDFFFLSDGSNVMAIATTTLYPVTWT